MEKYVYGIKYMVWRTVEFMFNFINSIIKFVPFIDNPLTNEPGILSTHPEFIKYKKIIEYKI